MKQYHDLLQDVLDNGVDYDDRTGVGVRSVFGRQARYDLTQGFPLLTTKKTHMKSIVHELLWFLKGDTNVKYLQENGVRIWNEWADEEGDLGPVYGKQWVSWRGKVIKAQPEFTGKTSEKLTGHVGLEYEEHNQIQTLVDQLKNNPSSRRLLVSAWNVSEIESMALPPCHLLFQFKVYGDELSCQLYQRSADLFLGVPFNIASYSLLTYMLAQVTGLKPKEFVHTIGDAHIYHNHFDQTKELLSRDPDKYALPKLELNPEVKDIFDFKYEDIKVVGYESYPTIKAKVAV